MSQSWTRLLILILGTAVVVHIAWALVRPALPFLFGLAALAALLAWIRWYRDRW